MVNPFLTPVGGSRRQFTQPQNQFDFSGWGDRLGKIEEGIAGLTEQFNDFQAPGDVEPEYLGNAAPEPLEQTANISEPLGGIESLVAEPTPPVTPMGGQAMGQSQQGNNYGTPSFSYHQLDPVRDAEQIASQGPGFDMMNAPSQLFGMGVGGRRRPIMPGMEGFNPLSAEQFASQKDLWGRRQDYSKFSSMAGDVTGMGGGIGGLWGRKMGGSDPRFGHAYESWQDYAAGYGGSDPSQGMENWMQDYNFDLAPTMPEFNAQPGGTLPPLQQWAQSQQDFRNTPEYQEWQQREEGRGPLSQSTIQAMGGMQHTGRPDIDPFISMGLGSPTATPTYEGYMDMVNRGRENYVPQSTTTSPNFASPGGGLDAQYRQQLQLQPALGGPIQQQIQQGLGSLSQGAGV